MHRVSLGRPVSCSGCRVLVMLVVLRLWEGLRVHVRRVRVGVLGRELMREWR